MIKDFCGILLGLGVAATVWAAPARTSVAGLDSASMISAVGGEACNGCNTRSCSYHDQACNGSSMVKSKAGSFYFCDTNLKTGCKLSNPGLCYTTYWNCNADCSKCDYNDVYKTKTCTVD